MWRELAVAGAIGLAFATTRVIADATEDVPTCEAQGTVMHCHDGDVRWDEEISYQNPNCWPGAIYCPPPWSAPDDTVSDDPDESVYLAGYTN